MQQQQLEVNNFKQLLETETCNEFLQSTRGDGNFFYAEKEDILEHNIKKLRIMW